MSKRLLALLLSLLTVLLSLSAFPAAAADVTEAADGDICVNEEIPSGDEIMYSVNSLDGSASLAIENSDEIEIVRNENLGNVSGEDGTYNGFSYYEEDGSIVICGISSTVGTNVVIPSSISGKSVSSVYLYDDDNDWYRTITSITIPDCVTYFSAYYGRSDYWNGDCENCGFCSLTELIIGRNSRLTYLGGLYSAKIENLFIPANMNEDGIDLYCDYIRSVSLSSGNNEFAIKDGCLMTKDLTRYIICPLDSIVDIPDGTTEIYYDTLPKKNMYSEEIRIPASVKTIDGITATSWGYYYNHLERITVASGNENYKDEDGVLCRKYSTYCSILYIPPKKTKLEVSADIDYVQQNTCIFSQLAEITVNGENEVLYAKDGVLFKKSDYNPYITLLMYPPKKSGTSYTVTSDIDGISSYAFYNCKNLTSVTIQDGVSYIGQHSFDYCSNLADISFPSSVKSVDSNPLCQTAYAENEANWENGILYCGTCAISSEYDIEAINLRNDTTVLAVFAFSGCQKIAEVSLPDNITEIPSFAFMNCTNLKNITIGKNVSNIYSSAFDNCKSITKITVDSNNANFSTDEYGVLYNKDKTELIVFPSGISLSEYTIGAQVTKIDDDFSSCYNLKKINADKNNTTYSDDAGVLYKGNELCCIPALDSNYYSVKSSTYNYLHRTSEIYVRNGARIESHTNAFSGFSVYSVDDPDTEVSPYYIEKTDLNKYIFGEHTKIIYVPEDCKYVGFDQNCLVLYGGTLEEAKENGIAQYCGKGIYGTVGALVCNWNPASDKIADYIKFKSTQQECYTSSSYINMGTDYNGRIKMKFSSDSFNYDPDEISLEIGTLTTGEKSHIDAYSSDKPVASFDIRATKSGYIIHPDKTVTLMFNPESFGCALNQLTIVHFPETGNSETFTMNNGIYVTTVDGVTYWCIDVSSLSPFAFYVNSSVNPISAGSISIRNMSKYNGKSIDYKSTITFYPDGENYNSVNWIVNGASGKMNADGSYTVEKATGNFTIRCTAKSSLGETIESETETVNVKHGFFDKLIAFFKGLFNSLPNITQ